MRDLDQVLQRDFSAGTMSSGLGPYHLKPVENHPVSMDQLNRMSDTARERRLLDNQGILLSRSALADSADEDHSQAKVKFNDREESFDSLMQQGAKLPDKEKITMVRDILNQNVTYVSAERDADWTRDQKRPYAPMKDVPDYAQTLGETLRTGRGDCEDFAVAGAEMLQRMGVEPDRVHVMLGTVYGADGKAQFDHANLAIRDQKGPGSSVMEIVNNGAEILPGGAYLQNGLEGQYFVPSVGVRADGTAERFDSSHDHSTPKARFMDPSLSEPTPSPQIRRDMPQPANPALTL